MRLMTAAVSAIFLYGMIAPLLGTLLPDLSARFQITPRESGGIAGVQALGLMLASVVAGAVIDKLGKKAGFVSGLTLITAALLVLASSAGWKSVMTAMFVLGLGSGATVTAANNLVSDIGEENRGALLSFANIFFGLGGLITPFLAANLLHRNSIALAYVIAALAASLLVFHVTTAMPAGAPQNFEISQALRLPGKRLLVLLSLLLLLYVACEVAVWNWLAKYLVSRGLSRSLALNILAFGFASGMMAGRLIGMRLLSRYSAASVSLVCSFLMAVATFWMLNSTTPVSACLSVLCTGIVMGPLYPSAMAMTGNAFTQMGATRMGIVITAGWIGAATSSWLIGAIAGGSDTHLRVALLLLPLFAVLMITVTLALRPLLAGIQSRGPIVYDARARPTI